MKLIITLLLTITSFAGITQEVPVFSLRVPTPLSDFVNNVPEGTIIVVASTDYVYEALDGLAAGTDITDAISSSDVRRIDSKWEDNTTYISPLPELDVRITKSAPSFSLYNSAATGANNASFNLYNNSDVLQGAFRNELSTGFTQIYKPSGSLYFTIGVSNITEVNSTGLQVNNKLMLDNTSTFIDRDGSNNMTFTDAVTGTKTLAELVSSSSEWTLTSGVISPENTDIVEIPVQLMTTTTSTTKTTSFTHHSNTSDLGSYVLNNSSNITVTIDDLVDGMMGTLFFNQTNSSEGDITISCTTPAAAPMTEIVLGEPNYTTTSGNPTFTTTEGKATSITYTCASNGTSTYVYLVWGQEQ